MKAEDFAKSFAQMITFTSLLAKLNTDSEIKVAKREIISISNLKNHIPPSFEVLLDLVKFFEGLEKLENEVEGDSYALMRWVVNDEILTVINNVDTLALNEELSYQGGSRYKDEDENLFARDPYIYFYEQFLQDFDKKEKQIRGAFYTPPPVVGYIIRGINETLKNEFGILEGLASEKITLLDFATGTGTFLVETFLQIFQELSELGVDNITLEHKIREHLLKNFFGFEYMIAPFAVAYLKISRLIEEKGKKCNFKFSKKDAPKIYLTNTLSETRDPSNLFNLKGLENHIRETMEVKKGKKILIITGNPPYLKSDKTTEEIKKNLELITFYPKSVETNVQVLSNLYIKFIRFAHKRIEENGTDQGIIGIITPTSYLEGITHRGMRNEIMQTFDKIYILNLHGKMGEDDNVFGDKKSSHIKEPVCITFFVKNKKEEKENSENCQVFYKSLFGIKRIEKYRFLAGQGLENSGFEKLNIKEFNQEFEKTRWAKNRFKVEKLSKELLETKQKTTLYKDKVKIYQKMVGKVELLSLFAPFSGETVGKLKEYGEFWGLGEIFITSMSGVLTGNDEKFIKFQTKDVPKEYLEFTKKIAYRPFDLRTVIYKKDELDRARFEIMQHMLKPNIGLVFKRKEGTGWVVNGLIERVLLMGSGGIYLAPLYLYKKEKKKNTKNLEQDDQFDSEIEFDIENKRLNFSLEFIKFIEQKYNCKLQTTLSKDFWQNNKQITPEVILGYIYAILNINDYRQKWNDFLDIDFPRIPFTADLQEFLRLANIGLKLIKLHLMEEKTLYEIKKQYKDFGVLTRTDETNKSNKVETPRYNEALERFEINPNLYLANVPKAVIEAKVGAISNVDGVLGQYLKARKDRELDFEEVQNIQNIVKILLEILEITKSLNSL